MLRWFSKLFARKPGTDGAQLFHRYRVMKARYDAAVTNSDNMRHWANADGFSANAANGAEVRRVSCAIGPVTRSPTTVMRRAFA